MSARFDSPSASCRRRRSPAASRRSPGYPLLRRRAPDGELLVDAANDADTLLGMIGDDGIASVVTTHQHGDHWQALAAVVAGAALLRAGLAAAATRPTRTDASPRPRTPAAG